MSTVLFSKYGISAHIIDKIRGKGVQYFFVETGRTYLSEKGALRAARAYYRRKFKRLGIQPKIIRHRRIRPVLKTRTGLITSYMKEDEEVFYVAQTGKEWDTIEDAVNDVFAYLHKMSVNDKAEQDSISL